MNDEQLDRLLEQAAPHFRVAPEPPVTAMWEGISAARRHVAPASSGALWWRRAGVAAAIVGSFALGRVTIRPTPNDFAVDSAATAARAGEEPVTAVATELLGQTVVLLTDLPVGSSRDAPDRRFAQQAGELLGTTRLLIDSPVAQRDPALRSLLEDLELVLAQLARMRSGESRAELELITDALQQQDIMPRIRSVAAGLSAGAD